jgi:hypothetical protein
LFQDSTLTIFQRRKREYEIKSNRIYKQLNKNDYKK